MCADGISDTEDIISLIPYWADKGISKISEREDKTVDLIKIKEIPSGVSACEKTVFNGLFRAGDTVNTDDLKESFYTTINSAKSVLKDNYEAVKENRIFDQISDKKKSFISFLTIVLFLISTFIVLQDLFYSMTVSIVFSLFPGDYAC